MRCMIFGAKSVALDVYESLRILSPENHIECFLVSSMRGNPETLAGLPVKLISDIPFGERADIHIIVAVPEILHKEIEILLTENGFKRFRFISSAEESALLEKYYAAKGLFPSVHSLSAGSKAITPDIYSVTFYKDKRLDCPPAFPLYVHTLHVGNALDPLPNEKKPHEYYDDIGDNISGKNPNYCEMTAFYWVWKNRLHAIGDYVGIYHYRRALDISDVDLARIAANDVDAVLPFPMMHSPDIREHHTRYVNESDWQSMLVAMRELYPDYYAAYDDIFSGRYFYNYNIIIARKKVFADYCAWVFPLLERTEAISNPKGWERGDRYTAYMSESLLTLYFMYHKDRLRIYHTGRILYI